jgi:hypothetical protein
MSQAQFLADASTVVVQAAFWSALAFIIWYSILAPWYRYPIGRALVALDSAIVLATLPSVLGMYFGASIIAWRGFAWLTVAAFGCIPLVTIWRGAIVFREQRRGARGG